MERTQIYLPKSQIQKLKSLAQKKNTTVSELVRDAVDVQYAPMQIKPALKKKRETLLEFAKRVNSIGCKGPRDLATNIDEYLYGGKK
ncbi:MAG: CopG family transcriptional regulator [Patescibacteria group bacterium]